MPRSNPSEWNRLNATITECQKCPRLRAHCSEIAQTKRRAYEDWEYWGRPVANFGPPSAQLLIVGLAPGAHGANRTGRMFTGDRSGDWLFRSLHRTGFASQPESTSTSDGLRLLNCAITAACHCAPPDNKPERGELVSCSDYLVQTIDIAPVEVFVTLGQIAWKTLLAECYRRNWLSGKRPVFGHGAEVKMDNSMTIIASYHPSQQNTFTGKLTENMLDAVFKRAAKLLDL